MIGGGRIRVSVIPLVVTVGFEMVRLIGTE